ncbi:UNVERIFIED_CONTAM: hypothetical protein PYX00_004479 [Menopon gallinae]|uniref:F-box domain-containing protein n=1 Tax=Menopon gallinae TaxID=328185 RepID=A0AAW2I5G3_9NEOP
MYEGAWKMDDKEKALFIDVEDRITHNIQDDQAYSDWDKLPDLLLERIFSYLSMREKYWASMTCRSWYRIFHMPNSWATFIVDDTTLTRRKFNYYSGWEHVLDHYRTMQCLTNVGRYFRYLIFEPMMNFNNLYQFMNMVSYYAEKAEYENTEEGIGMAVKALKFIFPCNMKQKAEAENVRIFGTGGQILASLKRLMSSLPALTELELIDLMLEYNDAKFLLDEVCNRCCLQLETLVLINLTKENYELLHPGVFLNLNILVISPQNLGDDLIQLLGYTKINHLHIKSNAFSPPVQGCRPVSPKIWLQCRKNNPRLSVHIDCVNDVLWQEEAPVKSIIFNSPTAMVQTDIILSTIEFYGNQLEVFAHHGIAYFQRPKSFHDRPDSSLVLLCRQCPRLCTLVIRERISTATVLLLASCGKQLRNLIIRRNAVIIKTDWPKSSEWTDEFYTWLKVASRKYEFVEKEVSQILGYRWKMLSDKEFRKVLIKPY